MDKSLLWRCRRGMKEMDTLLESFTQKYYQNLSAKEKQHFSDLLNEADLDIISWVTDRESPPWHYRHIIKLIKQSTAK